MTESNSFESMVVDGVEDLIVDDFVELYGDDVDGNPLYDEWSKMVRNLISRFAREYAEEKDKFVNEHQAAD